MPFKLSYKSIILTTLLLSTVAFVQAMDRDTIYKATKRGDVGAVTAFLDHNPKLLNQQDKLGRTPFHIAAEKGHDAIVCLLLSKPFIQIDLQEGFGNTPLHEAAYGGYAKIVSRILAFSSDIQINKPNKVSNRTPLHFAAIKGHHVIVERLIAHPKIIINPRDMHDMTPLHLAAEKGHGAVVGLLLARKETEIDPQTKYAHTPLHEAAFNGKEVVARLLLEYGANPLLRDQKEKTPLDLVTRYSPGNREEKKELKKLLFYYQELWRTGIALR